MREYLFRGVMGTAIILGILALALLTGFERASETNWFEVELPPARFIGELSVEEALAARRSVRTYAEESVTLDELSQLLWAAQGVTSEWGGRTAPSAGQTYPLEIYVVVGDVSGLEAGVYWYLPEEHRLVRRKVGELRAELGRAAKAQTWIKNAPVSLVIAACYERTTERYGERGRRYVHIEVGHVGQNVYLQAEALDLGTVIVGAFDDREVKDLCEIEEEPLAIMAVGKPAG